jgi:hypothetical protein
LPGNGSTGVRFQSSQTDPPSRPYRTNIARSYRLAEDRPIPPARMGGPASAPWRRSLRQ